MSGPGDSHHGSGGNSGVNDLLKQATQHLGSMASHIGRSRYVQCILESSFPSDILSPLHPNALPSMHIQTLDGLQRTDSSGAAPWFSELWPPGSHVVVAFPKKYPPLIILISDHTSCCFDTPGLLFTTLAAMPFKGYLLLPTAFILITDRLLGPSRRAA
jgi:hypothetical protein